MSETRYLITVTKTPNGVAVTVEPHNETLAVSASLAAKEWPGKDNSGFPLHMQVAAFIALHSAMLTAPQRWSLKVEGF